MIVSSVGLETQTEVAKEHSVSEEVETLRADMSLKGLVYKR